MDILAFLSFIALVMAWIVAPNGTAAKPAQELDRAA